MSEVNAVIGYLPDAAAKALATGRSSGPVEIRLAPGSDDVSARIDPKYISGTLLGASKKGETAVQVFLTDKATVETVSRASAVDLRLRPIRDLAFWPHGPVVVSIFAPPNWINQLVDLQNKQLAKG
jgi:hypothetical protein